MDLTVVAKLEEMYEDELRRKGMTHIILILRTTLCNVIICKTLCAGGWPNVCTPYTKGARQRHIKLPLF